MGGSLALAGSGGRSCKLPFCQPRRRRQVQGKCRTSDDDGDLRDQPLREEQAAGDRNQGHHHPRRCAGVARPSRPALTQFEDFSTVFQSVRTKIPSTVTVKSPDGRVLNLRETPQPNRDEAGIERVASAEADPADSHVVANGSNAACCAAIAAHKAPTAISSKALIGSSRCCSARSRRDLVAGVRSHRESNVLLSG